ncbi:MAG: hypothetical protein ACOC93_02470 [Planctomycetota bacterium]
MFQESHQAVEQGIVGGNLLMHLHFEQLDKLELIARLEEVPFAMQRRVTGFSSAQRCLAVLASQARGQRTLTQFGPAQRGDSVLMHWLGDVAGPHAPTISRTLSAATDQTLEGLGQILLELACRPLQAGPASTGLLWVDLDDKGLPAEGASDGDGSRDGPSSPADGMSPETGRSYSAGAGWLPLPLAKYFAESGTLSPSRPSTLSLLRVR